MRRRLTLGILVICLLAVVAVAQAAHPKNGVFTGKSAQKAQVRIEVSKGKISLIRFAGYCKGDKSHSMFIQQFAELDGRVDANGHFSETEGTIELNNGTYTVSGTFKTRTKAKGTLRLHGGACDTGKVKYTVKQK